MVMSNWAILSILTAVVSENMLLSTSQLNDEVEREQMKMKEERSELKLKELFAAVDKDGSGRLGKKEFDNLIDNEAYLLIFKNATDMEADELKVMFEYLAE